MLQIVNIWYRFEENNIPNEKKQRKNIFRFAQF